MNIEQLAINCVFNICHELTYQYNLIGESISGLYETFKNKGYYKVQQEHILKKNVCPKLRDPTECQSNINKFWRYITIGLFSDQSAKGLCTALIPYGVNCEAER